MSLSPTYIFLTDFSLTLWGLVFFCPYVEREKSTLCDVTDNKRLPGGWKEKKKKKKKIFAHTNSKGKTIRHHLLFTKEFPGVCVCWVKNKIKKSGADFHQ